MFRTVNYILHSIVVPLLRDHPVVHTDVVFEEGWSFIRGRKQCKPKHVTSGIVVLNVRWSLIRVVSQVGDYCNGIIVAAPGGSLITHSNQYQLLTMVHWA